LPQKLARKFSSPSFTHATKASVERKFAQLKQVESLAAANRAPNNAVGLVTERYLQKILNCRGEDAVLLSPGLETKHIWFLNLNLAGK